MPVFEIVRYQDKRELPARWRFHADDVDDARDEFGRTLTVLAPEADSAELYSDSGDLIDEGYASGGMTPGPGEVTQLRTAHLRDVQSSSKLESVGHAPRQR